ncbi:MAG: beta-lactamase family protein [Nitrospira sp.]|nr:beta-lactamase family protein [Nitrospira sp.]
MTDTQTTLNRLLSQAACLGAVSASVIAHTGAEPQTSGIPGSVDEPSFIAYSITKTFIATVVLRLCEEGRMRLEDPLARWFPNITQADHITVRQLLNHTAGIPDYGGMAAYHENIRAAPSTPWSFERFATETFEKGLSFEPGQGWAYSNPGYMLVKRIAAEVAGTSFRDWVCDRIAGPLGLQKTFVPESVEHLAPLAPAMSKELSPDRTPRDVRHCYHPGWVSHGVVVSTSSEIARFLDGLFRAELLSRHSLNQMTELVAVPGVEPDRHRGKPSYGLGVMGDPESPWGLAVGHNGGGPGYSASAFHAVDLGGASVCVMGAIEEGFHAESIVFEILNYLSHGRNPSAP